MRIGVRAEAPGQPAFPPRAPAARARLPGPGLRDRPASPAAWHDLGVVEYHRADFDAAITALRRALEIEPGHHLSEFWLGNALYHQGKLEEAIRAFERLLEAIPSFTIARFHLGVLYARRGDRTRAEEEFGRVLEDNPQDAAARFYVSG